MVYGGIDNSLNLSQNNVLSAVYASGGNVTYAYTYNASNLPLTCIPTTNGNVTETLRCDYESY